MFTGPRRSILARRRAIASSALSVRSAAASAALGSAVSAAARDRPALFQFLCFVCKDHPDVRLQFAVALERIDFGQNLVERRLNGLDAGQREVGQVAFSGRAGDVELGDERPRRFERRPRGLDHGFLVVGTHAQGGHEFVRSLHIDADPFERTSLVIELRLSGLNRRAQHLQALARGLRARKPARRGGHRVRQPLPRAFAPPSRAPPRARRARRARPRRRQRVGSDPRRFPRLEQALLRQRSGTRPRPAARPAAGRSRSAPLPDAGRGCRARFRPADARAPAARPSAPAARLRRSRAAAAPRSRRWPFPACDVRPAARRSRADACAIVPSRAAVSSARRKSALRSTSNPLAQFLDFALGFENPARVLTAAAGHEVRTAKHHPIHRHDRQRRLLAGVARAFVRVGDPGFAERRDEIDSAKGPFTRTVDDSGTRPAEVRGVRHRSAGFARFA